MSVAEHALTQSSELYFDEQILEVTKEDLEALRDITHAASTSRPLLTGVMIQNGPDGTAEAWATDSYMAARRELSFKLPDLAYVIFEAKSLKQAATSALKSIGGGPIAGLALETGASPTIHAGANRFSLQSVEGDFPKMRQVVTDDYPTGDGPSRVAMSAALVARVAKALSTPKRSSSTSLAPGLDLRFDFIDALKPIRVTSCVGDTEATAWIMPVRLS